MGPELPARSPDQDAELQQVFNLMVSRGINLFDTADSYGTGDLNGRSEQVGAECRDVVLCCSMGAM
jgi:aryl-alcohol dehydrogenase-like predicted oxidoreductase